MSMGETAELELRGLEGVLDTCLNQLNHGVTLEACLARHPSLAADLEPLLRVALRIRNVGDDAPPAPPAGLRAGRQRLLSRAAQLQAADHRRSVADRLADWFRLQPAVRRSMVTVVMAALLLVVVLGGGAASASANSLPGDVLYPVKRISEEMQLLLTFDWEVKAALQRQLEERRREEAKAIAESQRVAETSFLGQVESVEGQQWTVSGIQLRVTEETTIEGYVDLGIWVQVRVRSLSDGTLLGLHIAAQPEPAPLEPTRTLSPAPPTPTLSPLPTSTSTEVPPTAAPIPPIEPAQPSPTPQPSATAKPTSTPTATLTATLVPTTPAPPRDVKVRFQGIVEAISASAWTVSGRMLKVDLGTRIDESRGQAGVGAVAMVLALPLDDGSLLALEITIQQTAQDTEQPFEFQGLIESFGPTQWVVGGYTLVVTANTEIENSPQRGLLAEVKAARRGDGTIVATRILVRLPTERVQFEGTIQRLGANEWLVDGVVLWLDSETVIVGSQVVGAAVEVDGLLLPDGSVLARRITVQVPSATAPTALPTETPSESVADSPTTTSQPNSAEPLADSEFGPTGCPTAHGGSG
jgi:hypothetical protein